MSKHSDQIGSTAQVVYGICVTLVFALAQLMWGYPVNAAEHQLDNGSIATPVDDWTCVFADRDVILRYRWGEQTKNVTRVTWELSSRERTISRGEVRPKLMAGTADGDFISFAIAAPHLKPGVVLSVDLSVTVYSDKMRSAVHHRPLTVFGMSAFSDRGEWLKELGIRLYDPSGDTAKAFEANGIPFLLQRSLAAVDEVREGVLIYGAGTNLADPSAIGDSSHHAAIRGLPVLCLAPARGDFSLYGDSPSDSKPNAVVLRDEEVIRRYDKRFDLRQWVGGSSISCGLLLTADEHSTVARVSDDPTAWPWLELDYPSEPASGEHGKLILCGFAIVKHWDTSPVPSYLLRAILENLKKPSHSKPEVISDDNP